MFKYIDQLGLILCILTPILMVATYIFSLKIRTIFPYAITVILLMVFEIFYSLTIENPNLENAYDSFFFLEVFLVSLAFSIYFLIVEYIKKGSNDNYAFIILCVLVIFFVVLCAFNIHNELKVYEKEHIEQVAIEDSVKEENIAQEEPYFRYEASDPEFIEKNKTALSIITKIPIGLPLLLPFALN